MEDEHSKFWRLAAVVSLIALAAVGYVKIPTFRSLVDDKCPWVKEQLTKQGIEFADASTSSTSGETAHASFGGAPASPADFARIAADRSLWPKDVALKQTTPFPAVLDGKEVGKVNVPAGTVVQLYRIENGKVGVVYCGGGAWLQPQDTDLIERVRGR